MANEEIIRQGSYQEQPQEQAVEAPVNDPLADIDDDELSKCVMNQLRNDKKDKEDFGWVAKREYDEKAYNCYKAKNVTTPWKNAANFPVPLTRTLLDTAHSNIMNSIFADPENTVDARGVGPEDIRKEMPLESLLNYQVSNEIDAYPVMDRSVHLAFLQGTGIVKVIQDAETGSVKWIVVPAENIFIPLDAKGFQTNQTDHVSEIIPISDNYYEELVQLKDENGNPFYDGLEDVPKGWKIADSNAMQMITHLRDAIFGTELEAKRDRDYRYIVEEYLTYWYQPKGDSKAPKKKVELVVWFSPATTKVLRKRLNKGRTVKDGNKTKTIVKRPYAKCVPYPRWDRFWGESLPERLKNTQEELDYSHNQNINAADMAIRPMVLYPESQNITPEDYKTTPGAWIPVPDPKAVEVLRIAADPIFERQEDRYWDLAERDTGLTELFQGRSPDPRQTLGANVMRANKTEVRFKSVYLRIEDFWKDLIKLTYYYDSIYMPKSKKVKILGTADYKKISELFPEGLDGEFDFGFSGAPLTEKEQEKMDKKEFCMGMFANPLVTNDARSLWNVTKIFAEATGQRNLEGIVTRPQEANALSPDEAIQRVVSGQEVIPSVFIDGEAYVLAIQMFMQSDAYIEADDKVKGRMDQLMLRSLAIKEGQMQAKLDEMTLKAKLASMSKVPAQEGKNPQNAKPQQGVPA